MESTMLVKKPHIVEEVYRCIVCRQYATPPIYCCSFEHVICEKCLMALKERNVELCGICQQRFSRCKMLERISESISTACDYGCGNELALVDLATHQASCELGPWKCVFGCTMTIAGPKSILGHLKSKHQLETRLTMHSGGRYYYNTSYFFLGRGKNDIYEEKDLLSAEFGSHEFIVEESITESLIAVAVRLIGPKKDADLYLAKVTFCGTNIINKISATIAVSTMKDSLTVLRDIGQAAEFPVSLLLRWCRDTETGKHEWATTVKIMKQINSKVLL